jgi:hypothetical protein
MKFRIFLGTALMLLISSPWLGSAQSSPVAKLTKLAPPADVRVEAGANAIKVNLDSSPDKGDREFAGYTIYFDTKSLVDLSVDSLFYAVEIGPNVREYVVRGLENNRPYFFHIRSRKRDGSIGAASLPEKTVTPQADAKHYNVNMYDNDVSGTPGICGYGWSIANGQGIPGYYNLTQNGKNVHVVLMKSSSSKSESVLISPSEANFTEGWSLRNKTLIADIGTDWVIGKVLPDSAFTSTAVVRKGHVYLLKTHENYYVKLRVDSIDEVKLLLGIGAQRPDLAVNKITFTYASQLGQTYELFLTGRP